MISLTILIVSTILTPFGWRSWHCWRTTGAISKSSPVGFDIRVVLQSQQVPLASVSQEIQRSPRVVREHPVVCINVRLDSMTMLNLVVEQQLLIFQRYGLSDLNAYVVPGVQESVQLGITGKPDFHQIT